MAPSGETFVGGSWVLRWQKVRNLLGLTTNLEMTTSITPNKTLTIRIDEAKQSHPNKSLTLKNSEHQVKTPTKYSPKTQRDRIVEAPTKLSPITQQPAASPNKYLTYSSTHPQAHPNIKLTLGAFRRTEARNGAAFSPHKRSKGARSLLQGARRCTLLRQR